MIKKFIWSKIDNISSKLLIGYNISINSYPQNQKNKLLFDYSEISSILKLNSNDILYFKYQNRENINDILYKEEKYIKIGIKEENRNLANYYYLDLLINENKNIINYIYPIEFIEDINNFQKKIANNKIYTKICLAKIILDLIRNLKNYEGYDEINDEKMMNDIENENNDIINGNIKGIKELCGHWNLDYLKETNIDDIYIDIIRALYKQKNFRNTDYIYELLNQLEFESININENMLQEFAQIFNVNNNFMKEYMIKNIEDLFNIDKINFYFIIFKYLFKNQILIYEIPFLLKSRNIILNLIKNKPEELSSFNISNDIKAKFEFILETITDSKYYYNKYFNYKYTLPKLNSILDYYKNYLFESKKDDIILIQDSINKKKINNIDKYLKDYEIAQKMNERFSIINFFFKQNNENNKSEKEFNKYIIQWENIEKKIKEQKFEEISENDIQIIDDYLNNPKNEKLMEKIISLLNYKLFKKLLNNEKTTSEKSNSSDYNEQEEKDKPNLNNPSKLDEINNSLEELKTNEEKENQKNGIKIEDSNNNENCYPIESDSDVNGINKKYEIVSDDSMISQSEKENKESSGDESKNSLPISIEVSSGYGQNRVYKIESADSEDESGSFSDNSIIDYDISYSIFEFLKIIGKHDNTSEIVKELSLNKILSCGIDNIYIYENNFEPDKIKQIKEYKALDCINNIEELELKDNIKFNILVSTKSNFHLINLITEKNEPKNCGKEKINFFMKIDDSNSYFLVCKQGQISTINNAFCKILRNYNENKIEGYYKEGININKKFFAFTSNKIIKGGEDKIIFYNRNTDKFCQEIKNYSFILSTTGLYLIRMDNKTNDEILLCACKKYIKGQKNGILLISGLVSIDEYDYDKNKNIKFYDTKDFEVHCFCQLLNINENVLLNQNIKKTNYFLVGGFDKRKNKGIIKLYKIKENKDNSIDIEEIHGFMLEKTREFKRFNGPISCIEQIKNSGNILITCWDGNVYLFQKPNLGLIQSEKIDIFNYGKRKWNNY